MGTLRELFGRRKKDKDHPASRRGRGARAVGLPAGASSTKWSRWGAAAAVAVATVAGSAAGAWAYPSSSGFVDGYGYAIGTGNGLVLTEFYGFGQNATFRSKWLGAYNSGLVSANTPGGVNTDLWCIESGVTVTRNYSYSWSTDTNVRARYLMWLANNTWNNPDGRAAIQYLLYADAYPGLGTNNNGGNWDYESRIWAHADFTSGARAYVNAFRTRSTGQMHNTGALLLTDSQQGTGPTTGLLDGIGVTDAWGNYVPGLAYTITIGGPATFNATGTTTVTGTTVSSLRNDAHAWTANGSGQVDFTITYARANIGSSVYIGSGGGSQDMVAGSGFGPIVMSDPDVDVQFMFRPGGDTQVVSAATPEGGALVDVFTPSAIDGTTWGIDPVAAAYVPVTYDWALYDAGEVIPSGPVATAPAEWTLLEQIQVVAAAPGVPITSSFASTAQAGHAYVFVVSFANANQPLATQGWFLADWSDQYGLEDEVIYSPTTVTPTSTASSEVRGSDTAILDSVTFTGFPADHGAFAGTSAFVADVATVQQRLYFFTEGATGGVVDSNLAAAELVCDVTVPATNGTHLIDGACATARKDAWGQYVAGTYAWTSTFAGDARAGAFTTSVTDVAEQVTITSDPMALTTIARQAPGVMADGGTIEVWDTATVTGYVPVGSTLEFALYRLDSIRTPVCDADSLITTLAPVAALAGAGDYESDRFMLTIPNAAGVSFVETVRDVDGNVIHEGVCGAASETLPIARADDTGDDSTRDLSRTGASGLPGELGLAAALILAGVLAVVASTVFGRRRAIA